MLVTLGTLAIERPDGSPVARLLDQPKRFAVLLYLLFSRRGGSVSRDRIVGVFWPDADTTRARNALRQTLSFIRGCLGEKAVVGVGAHGLSAGSSLDCDALRFEALLDAGRREEALELYGGEFLPGFHISGSALFAAWVDGRRLHLSQRAAKAAWDLSSEHEARGALQGAAFWGKRALALSPFSESEVQRLVQLLGRVGDYTEALRAFHGLRQSLQAEFGAVPSAETARLIAELKARYESEGQQQPALVGTRRSGLDRRMARRRVARGRWIGAERRVQHDRRMGERRSRQDRREMH